jgi:hypothetical protein
MMVDLTGRAVKAVKAIVYEIHGDEPRFLVIQQADGSYTLPGGYKEIDDSNLLMAMKRTLQKTLDLTDNGYTIQETDIVGDDPDIYTDPVSGTKKDIDVHIFVVRCNGKEEIKASDDILRVAWQRDSAALLTEEYLRELFTQGLSFC